ncbi:hypothetical protein D2E26_0338 [Bifidobacterium dolichotidis]|uniref:Membrane associated protein n=2 Tax=Bifidobacterium dolichotidis TaxID=2306976 RepID=A0A430FSD1_9BIFI|nr:hypothetical protein D2E26_0338 [Bifidobacterium dolichotidis]
MDTHNHDQNQSANGGKAVQQPASNGSDDAWQAFMAEHEDDLNDVNNSRAAKKFNRKAQQNERKATKRARKQMMLSVNELSNSNFVGGKPAGPRDFTGSSWLDTDDVMDRHGSPFVPPNPDLSGVNRGRAALWAVLVAGIALILIAVLLPSWAGFIGVLAALCVLVGAGGLVMTHKGHDETKQSWDDDGARV